MMSGHGGNLHKLAHSAGLSTEEILDFSANINPLGPPEWLGRVIHEQIKAVAHYPDPDATALVGALARRYAVSPEDVVVGNGSSDILYALPRAFSISRVVIPVPSYIDYATSVRLAELSPERFEMREGDGFGLNIDSLGSRLERGALVLLGQPNNPTGLLFDRTAFCRLAERHSSVTFVVDEAFADFVEGYDTLIRDRPHNVVVLRSMTKFYAIPGLRLGFAVADPLFARRLRALLSPWSVNVFAQAVGVAALDDEDYARRTRAFVACQRERLASRLADIPGLWVYPGQANYLLVRLESAGVDAPELGRRLLGEGIAIRVCENFERLDKRFFRVAVRTEVENGRLCRALTSALSQ